MYKNFGFKENPFNTRPLEPNVEDIGRFVGRKKDIVSFSVDVSMEDRVLVIVTGHKGVRSYEKRLKPWQRLKLPLSSRKF